MNKILLALLALTIVTPVVAENDATYDPTTGSVNIPKVVIQGDTSGSSYAVTMTDQGGFNFAVTSVTNASGTNSIPEEFSVTWLEGKTLYYVAYGGIEPGLETGPIEFRNGYIMDGEYSYDVDATGFLTFGDDYNDALMIACGSTDQYIKAHEWHSNSWNRAVLLFFDESDASSYASSLTSPIPMCEN